MLSRRGTPWLVRRFNVAALDPQGRAAAAGRRIAIDDRFFPLACQRIGERIDLARVRGHLGLHTDRAQDQGRDFPWHEGMIWNLVLWARGGAAALLRREQRPPRVVPLEPGLALWLDITEVAHGTTALLGEHPHQHPEVVMVQVLGTPRFMLDCAIQEAAGAIAALSPGESLPRA